MQSQMLFWADTSDLRWPKMSQIVCATQKGGGLMQGVALASLQLSRWHKVRCTGHSWLVQEMGEGRGRGGGKRGVLGWSEGGIVVGWEQEVGLRLTVMPDPNLSSQAARSSLWLFLSAQI